MTQLTTLRATKRVAFTLAIVGSLCACDSVPLYGGRDAPAPIVDHLPLRSAVTLAERLGNTEAPLRVKAQWTPAQWRELPGWHHDRVQQWWPALYRGCAKPPVTWAGLCVDVKKLGQNWGQEVGDSLVREWVQSHLQPWRVSTQDGQSNGLLTGYFEPLLDGRRQSDARFQYPLYSAPADLGQRRPYYSRAELETSAQGRAALLGHELVYLADPLDVLMVQVQGTGRVRVLDEPDSQGAPKLVRMAFAAHNDQPYQSVARWLVDQGAFTTEQASWPAIRNWAGQNPSRVNDMLRANPRVVFFREEPLLDKESGPFGAQGVPLTPGRSIAVDRDSIPLGSPVWLDTTTPQNWAGAQSQPMQRLVMAQDVGSAIQGAVRADFFWGWGDEALAQAGRTKQPLAMWVLRPQP